MEQNVAGNLSNEENNEMVPQMNRFNYGVYSLFYSCALTAINFILFIMKITKQSMNALVQPKSRA